MFLIVFASSIYAQKPKSNQSLIRFSPSECDENTYSQNKYNQILNKEFTDSSTNVEVAVIGNCCVDFEGTIEVKDTIINLIYMESGDPCRCLCCYQFTYSISGISKNKNFVYLLNGKGVQGSE